MTVVELSFGLCFAIMVSTEQSNRLLGFVVAVSVWVWR